MTIDELNKLDSEGAAIELTKCCGAHNWVARVNATRPYENENSLIETAEEIWFASSKSDWLEAFGHHPEIGDLESLAKKFAATKEWAGDEQKSVDVASQAVMEKLARLNSNYQDKFGFIFIVCATGKSAVEMSRILASRIHNTYSQELKIAMEEQNKITVLRLKKLLS